MQIFGEAYICITCMWVIIAGTVNNWNSRVAFQCGVFWVHAHSSNSTGSFHQVSVATVLLCVTFTSVLGPWWHWSSRAITGSSGDPLTFTHCNHNSQEELLGGRQGKRVRLYWHSLSDNSCWHTVVSYKYFHPVPENASHSGCLIESQPLSYYAWAGSSKCT